uniref:Serpin family G member 1 n=1 Tax=Sphenodon punctatus TaxID=8508 RepID=A0A8D0HKP7_SPHPU
MKSWLILMCLAATIAVACSEHSVSESNGWKSTYLLTPGDSDNTTGREDSNGQFTLSKYGQEKGTEEPEVETRNTSNEGKDHSVGFAAMANTTEKKEEPISADSHELERVSERDHLGSLNATEPTTVFSTTEPTTAATTAEPTIVFSTTEPTTAATTAPQRCQHSDPWATCANPSSEDKAKLAEALTEFALRFYKTVISSERDDSNVVFSPLSVAVALSHLLLGARDETKRDLEMLLSYPEDFTCVHAAMKLLVKSEALISASTIFFHKGE